jgi:hypothetical protein
VNASTSEVDSFILVSGETEGSQRGQEGKGERFLGNSTVHIFTSLVVLVPNQEADDVRLERLLAQNLTCSSEEEVDSNTGHPGSQDLLQ